MRADRAAGVATLIAGVSLAVATVGIDILASQPTLSARFFPYVLAAVLCAGGLLLAVRPGETPLGDVLRALLARRGTALAGLFLVYALAFRVVDYRLATWVFVAAAMWTLGSRSWIELLIVPAAVSAGMYLLFRHAFTVMLPVWI